jgi:aromatic-L-amino-acid decarboxylase
MTPEEFRRYGHRVVDWIADYRTRVAERPVMSQVAPGEVRRSLPADPPEAPEPFDALLRDLDRSILPGLTHWQHPAFFAYFPANAALASVLGDLLSTGLGVIGLNWQAAPALTELEQLSADWLRRMTGLSDAWTGTIHDTASTATLVALLCARERTIDFILQRGGLQAERNHESRSVEKRAARRLRPCAPAIHPRDAAHALRPLAPSSLDRAHGSSCAIVATVRTTADRVRSVGAIAAGAREHGCWRHVDAALAGAAMILPECRGLWEGVEQADSIVVNAHKWLGAAFDCSLYYVRDPEHLVRVMSTNPSYLRTETDAQVTNLRDWGIPLGRRFRALKLWALIRTEGVAGLQARLRRDLENARWLAAQVDATPGWERVAPVPLQTVCVRHRPPGLDDEALDRHTLEWMGRINLSGAAYLNAAIVAGRWAVRVSIGMVPTERTHVEALWDRIRADAGMTWITRKVEARCFAIVLWIAVSLTAAAARAQQAMVWDSVGRVLQASPTPTAGYIRYNFPRRDLTLRVGDVAVSPRLALVAWVGFSGTSQRAVLMGDLVVTEAELLPVEVAIDSQHLAITAIHDHLVGESPRMTYIHVHGEGPAVELARRLDRILARTATPRGVAAPASAPVTIDTATVFGTLGRGGTASGSVAQIVAILVSTPVRLHGETVPPALAAATPINVQAVTADRFVATGDFAVTADRVATLVQALVGHGITVTAVHNHLIDESPPLYFVHFWADGPPPDVLGGLKAALDAARAGR